MNSPEQDLENRRPVWDALQMIFMDTDVSYEIPRMAEVCAQSPYRLEELREILFLEVFPACRFNVNPFLAGVAPEWSGFDINWLTERILRTHRHGKRRLLVGHRHTRQWWAQLAREIARIREVEN